MKDVSTALCGELALEEVMDLSLDYRMFCCFGAESFSGKFSLKCEFYTNAAQ